MKRIKSTGPVIKTREEMETVISEICQRSINRDTLKAQMDGYLKEVRERYEANLAYEDTRLAELTALAREWAEANPDVFKPTRSVEFTHGVVGWRTGMPQLKLLSKWTWEKVLEYCKIAAPQYVRTKHEVDKEQILSDRADLLGFMSEMGVKVNQAESFFIEPRRTETETRLTA